MAVRPRLIDILEQTLTPQRVDNIVASFSESDQTVQGSRLTYRPPTPTSLPGKVLLT